MNSQDLVQRLRMSGINMSDQSGETKHYEVEIMLRESPKIIFTKKDEPSKKGWQAAFDIGDFFSRVAWTEGEAPYERKSQTPTENLLNYIIKEMQHDEPFYPMIAAINTGLVSMKIYQDFMTGFYGNLFKQPQS